MATYHLRMKNDTKTNGTKISAKGHVDYINRENKEKSDCIFKAHQLPKWAKESPQKFFEAATRYEDKGNRRFKELELSLPNELSLNQNLDIVHQFLDAHLKNHYYAYAIHDKIGALSDGQHHPHVHIMFSERLIDDVERFNERPASKYFRRAAKSLKGAQSVSFERRREHGAPKDKKWHDKNYLKEIRADFAKIQNEVLAKNGFSIRVDHRSLKAQKVEAVKNDDYALSKILDRNPESYIGIQAARSDNPKLRQLKILRKLKNNDCKNILQAEFDSFQTAEESIIFRIRNAVATAQNLMNSDEYKNPKNIFTRFFYTDWNMAIGEVNRLKREFTFSKDLLKKAQMQYLSKEERKIFNEFHKALNQKAHLEDLIDNLPFPKYDYQIEAREAYFQICNAVTGKIHSLEKSIQDMQPVISRLQEKLLTNQKNIQFVAHHFLRNNIASRERLFDSVSRLENTVNTLQKALEAQKANEPLKYTYSTREIFDILKSHYQSLKAEKEKMIEEKNQLWQKVISPKRAIKIAQRLFLKNKDVELRKRIVTHQLQLEELSSKMKIYQQQKIVFDDRNWANDNKSVFIQMQYSLTKQKILLDLQQQKLNEEQKNINLEQSRLNKILQSDATKTKINEIAIGILRKNSNVAQDYKNLGQRYKFISDAVNHTKEQLLIVKSYLNKEKSENIYKFFPQNYPSNKQPSDNKSIASVIADALMCDEAALPAVGRLHMHTDWVFLTEAEKKALIKKMEEAELQM